MSGQVVSMFSVSAAPMVRSIAQPKGARKREYSGGNKKLRRLDATMHYGGRVGFAVEARENEGGYLSLSAGHFLSLGSGVARNLCRFK
jgi:hypothetical protein